MPEIPIRFDSAGALAAIVALVTSLRDGVLTPARAAELLDDLIDTGPWDELDDPVFLGLVTGLDALIPPTYTLLHLLDRDPANMRARAARVEAKNPERAARIRARADRVEARR